MWGNGQGLVGRVTEQAVCRTLGAPMGLMALQAGRDLFMLGMAAIAEQLCMPTRLVRHLPADVGMAGKTFLAGWFERITQGLQGLVRIDVAVGAMVDPVMGLIVVACVAVEGELARGRRMLGVAIEAADLCRMPAAEIADDLKLGRVAFAAIRCLQFGGCLQ